MGIKQYTPNEIQSLGGFVETLVNLNEMISDPKKVKSFLNGVDEINNLINQKAEILKARDEAKELLSQDLKLKEDLVLREAKLQDLEQKLKSFDTELKAKQDSLNSDAIKIADLKEKLSKDQQEVNSNLKSAAESKSKNEKLQVELEAKNLELDSKINEINSKLNKLKEV